MSENDKWEQLKTFLNRYESDRPVIYEDEAAPISHIWRCFQIQQRRIQGRRLGYGYYLVGARNTVWRSSELAAACPFLQEYHEVPNEHCGCGIYGWYTADKAFAQYGKGWYSTGLDFVLARCEYWGKTALSTNGVRTANARIVKAYVVLAHPDFQGNLIRMSLKTNYPDVEFEFVAYADLLTTVMG